MYFSSYPGSKANAATPGCVQPSMSQMEQQAFLVVVCNTVLLCCIFNCSSSAADACDRPGQYKLGFSNAEEILV